MAAPYTQADVSQGFGAETEINTETTKIETAFGTVLNKDDSTDNAMNVDLDMNGYNILNLGSVSSGSLSVTAGITASTTQSQGQQALTSALNQVSTVGNTNDVVTLPSAAAGLPCLIINRGANTLQIYPASGDAINGGSVDASVTLASGSKLFLVAYDATNWESF